MREAVFALVCLCFYSYMCIRHYILQGVYDIQSPDLFAVTVFRPVNSRSNAEQARRSQVLQDSNESLESVAESCTSCWVGKGHCEGFIHLRLSV